LGKNVCALMGRKQGFETFILHYPEAALRFTPLAIGYYLKAASRQKK
jgi:hypothetical protein